MVRRAAEAQGTGTGRRRLRRSALRQLARKKEGSGGDAAPFQTRRAADRCNRRSGFEQTARPAVQVPCQSKRMVDDLDGAAEASARDPIDHFRAKAPSRRR